MTLTAALPSAIATLKAAGVNNPARDARLLLAHAVGVDPARLTLHMHDDWEDNAEARFIAAIKARAGGRPVSKITGKRLFWGELFSVNNDVLDPRPETETLVEAALQEPFSKVLDLGTGSGCILISLLQSRPEATGLGADVSEAALKVARENGTRCGGRVDWRLSDWFSAIDEQFDLIVSNPPYIAADEMAGLSPEVRDHDPHLALTDHADGLSAYRLLSKHAPSHLQDGGRLMVEIGPTQGAAVSAMFVDAGFVSVKVLQDLDGRDRVVIGRQRKVSDNSPN